MNKLSSSNGTRRFGNTKSISQIIDCKHVPPTPTNSPVEPIIILEQPVVVVEPVVVELPKLKREDSTVKRQRREDFLARFKK